MYGPFLGTEQDIDLGNGFSTVLDVNGGLLMNFAAKRAKYELQDGSIQIKNSQNDLNFTPNLNVGINLYWRPIKGVEMRVGYSALGYFNSLYMSKPIDFNYGAIDPAYNHQLFRLYHYANVGVSIIF